MRKSDHGRQLEFHDGGHGLAAAMAPAMAPAYHRPPSSERVLRGTVQLIGAANGLGLPGEYTAEGPAQLKARLSASRRLRGRISWHGMLSAGATLSQKGFPPRGLGPFSRRLAAAVA